MINYECKEVKTKSMIINKHYSLSRAQRSPEMQ
jgi:hypothetical protein